MLFFPPAKLNLGLHVLGKRSDGFHNLESVFLPTPWTDVLEVRLNEGPSGSLEFTTSGLDIPGTSEGNLVVRAHAMLAERHALPGLHVQLHKVTPMGAGLGGGSADGTHTLMAINEVCGLGLSLEELAPLAANLGSDCPFFLHGKPALVSGRGEVISPLEFGLPLDGWWLVIHHPGIHVSTAEAFGALTPAHRQTDWAKLSTTEVRHWDELIQNDFEPGLANIHPEIQHAMNQLKAAGAHYAQMTGSGSAVFGLFDSEQQARDVDLDQGHTFVGLATA